MSRTSLMFLFLGTLAMAGLNACEKKPKGK